MFLGDPIGISIARTYFFRENHVRIDGEKLTSFYYPTRPGTNTNMYRVKKHKHVHHVKNMCVRINGQWKSCYKGAIGIQTRKNPYKNQANRSPSVKTATRIHAKKTDMVRIFFEQHRYGKMCSDCS